MEKRNSCFLPLRSWSSRLRFRRRLPSSVSTSFQTSWWRLPSTFIQRRRLIMSWPKACVPGCWRRVISRKSFTWTALSSLIWTRASICCSPSLSVSPIGYSPIILARRFVWRHCWRFARCCSVTRRRNADYGWHPFSRPLNQILEDMIEKEVKKRVEKELRIRALKKAQDEIGKKWFHFFRLI